MIGIFVIAVAYYGAHARALLPHLLASLVHLDNVLYAMPSTVNVVACSLEVEVQFYVLAPLMALVFVVPNASVAGVAGFAVHLLVQAVILVPIVLLASTVFFVVIERPCMRKDWPSRLAAAVRLESLESSRKLIPQRVRSIWGP